MARVVLFCMAAIGLILVSIDGNAAAASPKEAEAFYKGATVKIVVPYGPGGTFDQWARAVAPYLEKHTKSRVIVENMPGAAGLVGGAYLYSLAKPDGLTLAIMSMPGMAIGEMLGLPTVKYDLGNFAYIGRLEFMYPSLMVSKASGFKSIADMQKSAKAIRFGTIDPSSISSIEAALVSEAYHLKSKIIAGYKGGQDLMLALTAGRELDAMVFTMQGYEENVKKGDFSLVAVSGRNRNPDFPEVPFFLESPGLTSNGRKLLGLMGLFDEVGRMIVAPPNLPEAKRSFLEKALSNSLKEPALLNSNKKMGFNVNYLNGKDCKELITKIKEAVPKEERAQFRSLVMEKYF